MNKIFKKKIPNIIPPLFLDIYKKYFLSYGWFGNYKTWYDAKKNSTGYDSDLILRKVKNSLLKVKKGEAVYERDSVLFEKKEYSSAILAGLLLAKRNDSLFVVDFGGSLGTTYFQNKYILDQIKNVSWNIIEQKNFVKCGKKYFQDEELKFYENFEQCLKKKRPNLLILSSVLPYLEKPYRFIEEILKKDFEYILIDRTPFIQGKDRLTIQKVNPRIYTASYPCWFFNEKKMLEILSRKYKLISEFAGLDKANIKSEHKGFLFVRK